MVVALLHQSSGGELLHDGTEKTWRGRHVIEEVLMSRMIAVDLSQAIFDLRIDLVVAEITGKIIEAARKTFPEGVLDAVAAILFNVVLDPLAEILVRHLRPGHAQHREFLREQIR